MDSVETLNVRSKMNLKQQFFEAVSNGDLGSFDDLGVIVTLKELEQTFPRVDSGQISRFLPSATIDAGQHSASEQKFVFHLSGDAYRVHPDAIELYDNP